METPRARRSCSPSPLALHGDMTMRFMVLVKADKNSEAGVLPDEKLLAHMGKYNEELAKAGVLLDASGLQPTSKGARIKFSKARAPSWTAPSPNRRSSSLVTRSSR